MFSFARCASILRAREIVCTKGHQFSPHRAAGHQVMVPYVRPSVFCPLSNCKAATASPVEKLVVSILEPPAQWERFMAAVFLRLGLPPDM
jgi:hypothetical protein